MINTTHIWTHKKQKKLKEKIICFPLDLSDSLQTDLFLPMWQMQQNFTQVNFVKSSFQKKSYLELELTVISRKHKKNVVRKAKYDCSEIFAR